MDISKVIPWVILALAVIAAVAIFAVTLIQASPARRREILNSVLMSLAVEAERLYGAKTGQLKKKQVIAWLYARYKWLMWFVSEESLSKLIDEVVARMNEWMKSNPVGAENALK